MGNLISERGVMEKSQEKFKGLRYSIGENAEDLLSKFGKYMTTILNDGGGGVIILKIWANIDVLVDQIKQEIGKITPRVQDNEYKISSKRRNGDIGEIEIDVEPVPWGFEAYAAADGNIYTPETGDHATDENEMDFQFEYTEPKMNTKMKPTVEIGEMETHSDCELGDIRQEKTDKNTGAPPSDIKEIIDDCVNDLRDIKAKLGISNRCDQPEQMDTMKITSDVEKCIISVSEEEKTEVRLHHSKSLSDNLSDAENRRPFLQMKSGSLTDNEIKTLCEDFEFNQCKDFNSFPTTTENWIQVDGEGYVENANHRETDYEYFLPQLDGLYCEENYTSNELRMVLIGKTGSGKSATGNTSLGFTGRPGFTARPLGFTASVNTSTPKEEGKHGKRVVIVDTPGLFDTRKPEDTCVNELSKTSNAPGPHVSLIIVSLGQNPKAMVIDNFGEPVLKMFLMMLKEDLTKHGQSFELYKTSVFKYMNEIVQNFENRYLQLINDAKGRALNQQYKEFLQRERFVIGDGCSASIKEIYNVAENELQHRMLAKKIKLQAEKDKENRVIKDKFGRYQKKYFRYSFSIGKDDTALRTQEDAIQLKVQETQYRSTIGFKNTGKQVPTSLTLTIQWECTLAPEPAFLVIL